MSTPSRPSTPLVLAGPLDDPEAHAPITDTHVARALDDATVAAAHAQLCWRRLLDALERGDGATQAQRSFERAFAEISLRWAYFHAAADDHQAAREAGHQGAQDSAQHAKVSGQHQDAA